MEALAIGEQGTLKEITDYILKVSGRMLSVDDIWRETFADKDEIQAILSQELELGQIVALRDTGKYLSKELLNYFLEKINSQFEELYKKYPFRYWIDREELKSKAFGALDSKDFATLMKYLVPNNYFTMEANNILQVGEAAVQKIFAMKETSLVEKTFLDGGLNITSAQQVLKDIKIAENKLEEIMRFLIQTGTVIELNDGIFIHKEVLKLSVKKIREIIDDQGSCTAPQIRDSLGIGRKIAIAILEYLDAIEVTNRLDDVRKPGAHYMDYFI
jgi:selenocysteine-specific elongation factor